MMLVEDDECDDLVVSKLRERVAELEAVIKRVLTLLPERNCICSVGVGCVWADLEDALPKKDE